MCTQEFTVCFWARDMVQLGRITLNVAKVPEQMEKQRRKERLEELRQESGSEGLIARMKEQVLEAYIRHIYRALRNKHRIGEIVGQRRV